MGDKVLWGRNKGKNPSASYALARKQAANYTDPRKVRLDARRREVMRLRQEEGWRTREITEWINLHADKFLEEGVTYSHDYVARDILAGLKVMTEDLEELAKQYLPGELAQVDDEQQQVLDEFERVKAALSELDPIEDIDTYEKLVKVYETLLNRVDRLRSRRAKYLPLETPKKTESHNTEVKVTLDDFLRAKKNANANIVEGELVEDANL